MPWAPSVVGRVVRGLSAPMIWANWRALESLLNMQFGLKKLGLRPKTRIEDSIHCATSIETPGFYKAIRDGRIKAIKGNATSYKPGALVVDGSGAVPADIVVLAIGWKQGAAVPRPVDPRQARHQRRSIQAASHDGEPRCAEPRLRRVQLELHYHTLGPRSARIGSPATWTGELARQPSEAQMRKDLDKQIRWKKETRKVAQTLRRSSASRPSTISTSTS